LYPSSARCVVFETEPSGDSCQMPRWCLLAVHLAVPAACAHADGRRGGGSDGLSLVQHSVRAEAQTLVSGGGAPSFYDDEEEAPAGKLDDGKAPAPSFYDDGKAPAAHSADDGKAPGGKPGDWKADFPVPEYQVEETAEVIATSGPHAGVWNPCIVKGITGEPGKYMVYLPNAPQGHRFFPSVHGKYLRKEKPDAAAEAISKQAEAFVAQMTGQKAERSGGQVKEMAKWFSDKGLVNAVLNPKGDKPTPTQLGMAPKEQLDTYVSIAKMLEEVQKGRTTPPPLLSPQDDLLQFLNTSGSFYPAWLLRKMQAKAGRLSQDKPLREEAEAAELKSSAPKVRTREEEAQDLANEPVINGTWSLGGMTAFNVHNTTCKLYFEGKIAGNGQFLVGAFREEGEWISTNLTNLTGHPSGTVRLRLGKEPGTAIVNFRNTDAQIEFGQTGWTGDVVAHRKARTMDPLPGKCNFKSYGCKCINGDLTYPGIFYADVGEDVEIFKSDGSGWYPATVVGINKTSTTYSVFIPEGPADQRIVANLQPDWLRRVKQPAPPRQEEPAEAPEEARAGLNVVAAVAQPRVAVRQEEEAPVATSQEEQAPAAGPAVSAELAAELAAFQAPTAPAAEEQEQAPAAGEEQAPPAAEAEQAARSRAPGGRLAAGALVAALLGALRGP